jgi:uncharacterized protein (TIGR01732 family)
MKYVIVIGIVLTFGLLFTTSSGILKGEAFAVQEEERNGYDYKDEYSQGYDKGYNKDSFYGIDNKELLEEIGNKLFEGIDKERLLNNALNLLNEYDIDIGALNEQLLQDGTSGYGGAFVLILVLFILLVIIGAGFGLGFGGLG